MMSCYENRSQRFHTLIYLVLFVLMPGLWRILGFGKTLASKVIIVVQGASPRLATFSSGQNNKTKYYCYQVRGDTIK
jgi:hypothetical protein